LIWAPVFPGVSGDGSKHDIYLDKPEVVLSAFREIVEAARKANVAPKP
jgi:hypothetical protein